MNKLTLAVLLFCILTGTIFAQKTRGIPDDLDSSGIVFLRYEALEIKEDAAWSTKKEYKIRNKWAKEANKELDNFNKEYPYKNTTATRTTPLDSLLKSGYKYRLNCEIMDNNNAGIASPDPYSAQVAPLYIENIETQEIYVLFDIKQSNNIRSYEYGNTLKKFHEKIKQKFGL